MAEPKFIRTPLTAPLYYLDPPAGPPGYAVAFYPHTITVPDVLMLSETWRSIHGIYIFVPERPANPQQFVNDMRQVLTSPDPRFFWLANPAAPLNHWLFTVIDVAKVYPSYVGNVISPAVLRFENYQLVIQPGCQIRITQEFDGFIIEKLPAPDSIALRFTDSASWLPASGNATLPFNGPSIGCCKFPLPILNNANMDLLDAGLRYFMENQDLPIPGLMSSLRYPVLSLMNGPITLQGSFDPINPFDGARTCFGFLSSPPMPVPPIPSAFRSVYGEQISLVPVPSEIAPLGPRLVFSRNPRTLNPGPDDPLYLTYAGSFRIEIQNPVGGIGATDPEGRIMCGTSGLEYAGLMAAAGNLIHFAPGQPAFAQAFPKGDAAPSGPPSDAPLLTDVATTSWVYITPPGGSSVRYFAQPKDSTFYKAELAENLAGTGLDEDFLYYLEVFAGSFPPTPPQGNASFFPMVPYAMTNPASIARMRVMENNILSPARRSRLNTLLQPTETGPRNGSARGATPQGLLLTLDQELKYWETLTLARHAGGTQLLQLGNITGGFKAALQSDQLFAVISNRDEFLRHCDVIGNFGLTIDDWVFKLGPENWGEQKTIAIIKYADRSIEDLAADTSLWNWKEAASGYADLQGNLATTQADLLAFIQDARARADNESDFKFFYDQVISSTTWSGVIFLRVHLALDVFPQELQGLAAGIDSRKFLAHHIGITATQVRNIDGTLEQRDSSIFGLINYDSPEDLVFTGKDYDYKVLSLKVLYANSVVSNFFSQVELYVYRMFGEIAILENSLHGNNILLNGFYQKQNGGNSYQFIQDSSNRFLTASNVLPHLEISSARFSTLRMPDEATGNVRTQFVFAGSLEFAELEELDIFSFGMRYDENGNILEQGGLSFSNMTVEMNFPKENPGEKTFIPNVAQLAFDISRSTPRSGSLYAKFPITLSSLIAAPEKTKPQDLGFTAITSPLPQSELGHPWYALSYTLSLGNLGALAGGGGLTATILAGWSPGKNGTSTWVGISMPGASGSAFGISLQGILRLQFKRIEMERIGEGARTGYQMRFRRIGIGAMGITLPRGALDLSLFSDPSGGRSDTLGWYAAYAKDS